MLGRYRRACCPKIRDVLRAVVAERKNILVGGGTNTGKTTSLALSQSMVNDYLRRFEASGRGWPLPPDLDEAGLEAQLFARPRVPAAHARPVPDWPRVHRELRRTGATLHLPTITIVEPTTGEMREAQFFVGALGASNYFYAEATWTQTLPD